MTHTRDQYPTDTAGRSRTARRLTYGRLDVVVLPLALTGLVVVQSGKSAQDAEVKADRHSLDPAEVAG